MTLEAFLGDKVNLFIELELCYTQYKKEDCDCFSLLVFSVEEKTSYRQFHTQSDLNHNNSRGASHFDGDGDGDGYGGMKAIY